MKVGGPRGAVIKTASSERKVEEKSTTFSFKNIGKLTVNENVLCSLGEN